MSSRSTGSSEDRLAIRDVAEGYASAIDHHRRDDFIELFGSAGALATYHGNDPDDQPRNVHRGAEALGRIVDTLATMYPRTFHLVGNHRSWVDGETATAETWCTAHHLTVEPFRHGATDYVMHIRYLDDLVREDGAWVFATRRMLLEWSGIYPVLPDEVAGHRALDGWEPAGP